ncbi:uncharacterized protein TRUGW13939_05843 [Talaromyces rugulosus]|uniref:Uncharacterized protein n=1 Tax=Talaromyces rugulosus TaxID=121627 RepID=A0A7H8QY58_TALRU|nr:uncharacterized protein TRUGW13939_05843 [Talaromyces rugulosus]QKX58716.1 hypothetical protein TRUGW13939_05843 [Talaromyces rugulosus]
MEPRPDHQFDSFKPSAAVRDAPRLDLDSIDWNDPASFAKIILGDRPIPELKSPADVRREATARSDKIFTSFETLHEILKRHEATIWKRWSKKTRQQRLKILLNAWPNMPAVHRPDFDAFRKESRRDRHQGTKYRESFMWPYINQEDLLNTKALPLLLNARGRHHPSHFAAADVDAMHLGLVTEAIMHIYLNEHVMVLNGVTENTREYGKLVAWTEHPDAFDWMHKLTQFLPGEGLSILEAQERLSDFLVQCCLQILHDIPESTLTTDSFSVLPEPQLKRENEISGFESLGVMAAEAPYRLPARLDLHYVESLLSARAFAAEDHLWALREDPDYFSRTLLEAKDHRQEILKDIYGNEHPVFSRGREEILWGRIIGSVVSEAYLELEVFSELNSQAKKLVTLQQKYADDISPSEDLPEEYLEALLRFHHHVNQAAKGPLATLKTAAVASPPLRRLFARHPPSSTDSTKISTVLKPGIQMDKVENHLIWLLRTLWEDGMDLFLIRMPVIVDELERLLQSETRAGELLSSYITTVVGDLSIIAQCLNQLNLYQPWARSWESEFAERDDDLKQEFAKRAEPWARIIAVLSDKSTLNKVASLGEPSGGKFSYPVAKRRTKENVEALRKAEGHLDAFWAGIDQVMFAKAGDLPGTAIRNFLSQPRILQRTLEWVEPEKATPLVPAQDKAGEVDLYASYQPISQVYSGISARTLDVAQPKTKAKTRGTARPEPVTEAEMVLQPNPADRQRIFPVDARALKVFRVIFFNPAVTSSPGEVPWNDFLHAMTSVGFTAMKLYGSVWQFQPSRMDIERNIQFHEPHPRGKLPFTTARRYGRRLNRAYGWIGGMFVLGDK